MTLIERLEAATEPSRELSDECLLAIGWQDAGKHLGQWIRPDGSRCYKSDAPDPSGNVRDTIVHMVPEGWDWDIHSRTERGVYHAYVGLYCSENRATPALALSAASLKAIEARVVPGE